MSRHAMGHDRKRGHVPWGCARVAMLVFGALMFLGGLACLAVGVMLVREVFGAVSTNFDAFAQALGITLAGLGGVVAIPGLLAFLSGVHPAWVRFAHVLAIILWVIVVPVCVFLVLYGIASDRLAFMVLVACAAVLVSAVYSIAETSLRHQVEMWIG